MMTLHIKAERECSFGVLLTEQHNDQYNYTSAKIIQLLNECGCRDVPCEKSWKQGSPQSCVTLCLNM